MSCGRRGRKDMAAVGIWSAGHKNTKWAVRLKAQVMSKNITILVYFDEIHRKMRNWLV